MNNDLVKQLRDFAVELRKAEDALLVRDAADAIEELSAYAALYKDGGETAMKVANDYKERVEELSKERDKWKATAQDERDAYRHWFDQYQKDVPKWIPVTERLPDAGERVLCYCRANIYEVMKMRTDGDWVYDTNHIYMHSFVTHWMPLPEPPKEE